MSHQNRYSKSIHPLLQRARAFGSVGLYSRQVTKVGCVLN